VDRSSSGSRKQILYPVKVTGIDWLAESTFEIRFQRPKAFEFQPGQKIGVVHAGVYRDYTLINAVQDQELALCVRHIADGELTPVLAGARMGDVFHITPAFGYFVYQSSRHPAVFAATGTGIAPFVAFARAGVAPSLLLHGVRASDELYYHEILSSNAEHYTPCISAVPGEETTATGVFPGRVTDFLERQLPPGNYDFYLCGRSEMLRDAMGIIDRRFSESRVFSELFF